MHQFWSVESVSRLVPSQQISGRDDDRQEGRSRRSRGHGSGHPHQSLREVQLRIVESRGPQEQVVGGKTWRRNVFSRFQVRKTTLNLFEPVFLQKQFKPVKTNLSQKLV